MTYLKNPDMLILYTYAIERPEDYISIIEALSWEII